MNLSFYESVKSVRVLESNRKYIAQVTCLSLYLAIQVIIHDAMVCYFVYAPPRIIASEAIEIRAATSEIFTWNCKTLTFIHRPILGRLVPGGLYDIPLRLEYPKRNMNVYMGMQQENNKFLHTVGFLLFSPFLGGGGIIANVCDAIRETPPGNDNLKGMERNVGVLPPCFARSKNKKYNTTLLNLRLLIQDRIPGCTPPPFLLSNTHKY